MRNQLTARFLNSPAARSILSTPEVDSEASQLLRSAFGPEFLTRPLFLERQETEQIRSALNVIADVLFSLPERMCDGDLRRFAGLVGIREDQADLLGEGIQEPPVRYGRADLYFDGDRFRTLEFNLGSPVGGLQVASISRALYGSNEHMRDFVQSEALELEDPLPALAAMLRAFAADHGRDPVVAVMDGPASYAATEPHLAGIARGLRGQGIEAFACSTADVRDTGTSLRAAGRHFSLVYRFFTLNEMTDSVAASEHAAQLLGAFRTYGVPVFTPLSGVLFSNKTVLAMLHSKRLLGSLSAAESEAVREVLPWTHVLADEEVEVRGAQENLLEYARQHRDSLVIKPSDGLGGQGVVLGNQVSSPEWEAALREGVVHEHVLQERIAPPVEQFVAPEPGAATSWVPLWGAFLIGREYAGTMVRAARASESGVIALSRGAQVGCVYRQTGHCGNADYAA
ncbi:MULTISPECIES: glutathionylspermidine synthase family protein [Actinomycetes]|uniref:glutathionylspermidine synthase family protein n=1 Tax=Actinomycetes TaxID=1760 RepID=UPI0001DEE814|nr:MULTISPECIES: glutathionylspermidine synthase family protein [Actinomycetes]EFL09481.1 predicted protein [Streptomyces sp. AA4]